MIRRIIHIDKEKCNGCGACAKACHEGAIGMVNGKAELLRDDYCDGLGDCLPTCPTGAITFIEREALEYDKEAVEANMKKKKNNGNKIFSVAHQVKCTFSISQKKVLTILICLWHHSLVNGLAKLNLCLLMHRILTMRICSLPQIAQLMLTQICTANL